MIKVLLLSLIICWSSAAFPQHILPTPRLVEIHQGSFTFPKKVRIYSEKTDAAYLDWLKTKILQPLHVSVSADRQENASIGFVNDSQLPAEAYTLSIKPEKITIKASGDAGFFYGVQSLFQLSRISPGGQLPALYISDAPRYTWRSFLLDSGRQFQSVATIKKYLDMMALLKMNTFHWHLTEGLGWRLEIKKYPKLTEIGAFVGKAPEQQGFYTQEDVKEIIRYAAQRNIRVVPEIDMPGHAEAALTAYPELGCFGQVPPPLKQGQGFSENIFCAGKAHTMQFLKDVLDEVCELFPSVYIHTGGDEAPKKNWDSCPDCQTLIKKENLGNSENLQLYFSAQIADYLKSKGKKAIFWEDIMYHDGYKLPDNVVIHWWNWRAHRDKALQAALAQGHPVICGTNYYTYLNFPVTPWSGYKVNRTFDIRDAYEKNPSMNRDSNALVLGMSAALWTDYNVREAMIDRRLFPRIFALAEQMWHQGEYLSFDKFYKKVTDQQHFFESMGYQFGPGLKSEVKPGYSWD